jgi:OTU-like cysteine protease
VPGDGDCFYHAVKLYLPKNYEDNTVIRLRHRVADYIQDQLDNHNNQDFRVIIKEQLKYHRNIHTVNEYVEAIRNEGTIWADNLQIKNAIHGVHYLIRFI